MLTLAYIGLSVLGCTYIIVALFLGHFADGDGGGADADGSGHGAEGAAGAFVFPLFSPLALATLFAAIGGYGLIAKYGLRVADSSSILVALPTAFVTAYVVTYAGWRIMQGSRGSSQIRNQDLVGASGEVLTPIPTAGVGEVAAMVGEQRFTAPARTESGGELPRGVAVTVVRMSAGTMIVRPRS